jgi:uncharacterized protein YutE (UPF0331/DUF86 family)
MKWQGIVNKLKKPLRQTVGDFVKKWADVESSVKDASGIKEHGFSFLDALKAIGGSGKLASDTINKLHELRKFRNDVVHDPDSVSQKELGQSLKELSAVKKEISNKLGK